MNVFEIKQNHVIPNHPVSLDTLKPKFKELMWIQDFVYLNIGKGIFIFKSPDGRLGEFFSE